MRLVPEHEYRVPRPDPVKDVVSSILTSKHIPEELKALFYQHTLRRQLHSKKVKRERAIPVKIISQPTPSPPLHPLYFHPLPNQSKMILDTFNWSLYLI